MVAGVGGLREHVEDTVVVAGDGAGGGGVVVAAGGVGEERREEREREREGEVGLPTYSPMVIVLFMEPFLFFFFLHTLCIYGHVLFIYLQ